jgi:hypothetical protein
VILICAPSNALHLLLLFALQSDVPLFDILVTTAVNLHHTTANQTSTKQNKHSFQNQNLQYKTKVFSVDRDASSCSTVQEDMNVVDKPVASTCKLTMSRRLWVFRFFSGTIEDSSRLGGDTASQTSN